MKFGLHVSIAGGVANAPERAAALGCDCFQIFVSNPRSWKLPACSPEEAERFRYDCVRLKLRPVVVHLTYLVNLASPDPDQRERALTFFKAQYRAAAAIGAEFFVMHPGSHKETTVASGIDRIAEGIRATLDEVGEGPVFLLENTAGGGSTIGRNAEELGQLAAAVDASEKLGLCLDTCHAWAMGVDVAADGGFKRFMTAHEKAVGRGSIRVIHMNDSMNAIGTGRDRHQHIGLGHFGNEGVRNILHTSGVRRLPFILETPVNDQRNDVGNLAAVRALA